MKLTTGAVLLAVSGAITATPVPSGSSVLLNVHDDCSNFGPDCVPAAPFLHHLADSEKKFLHLVHPESGKTMRLSVTGAAEPLSGQQVLNTSGPMFNTKTMTGTYPNVNQATGAPPPDSKGLAPGSAWQTNLDLPESSGQISSSADPPSSTGVVEGPLDANKASSKSKDGTAPPVLADPTGTMPSGNLTGPMGSLPDLPQDTKPPTAATSAANPSPSGSDPSPQLDGEGMNKQTDQNAVGNKDGTEASDIDPLAPNDKTTDPNKAADLDNNLAGSTTSPAMADPKPVIDPLDKTNQTASAANITGGVQNPGSLAPPASGTKDHQQDGALGLHKDVILSLCSVLAAAAGALFLL